MDVDNATIERMGLEGATKPSPETLAALTGEGGPLQNGVMPQCLASCEEGEKALLASVTSSQVSKTKFKPIKDKDKEGEDKEVVPKTAKENPSSI